MHLKPGAPGVRAERDGVTHRERTTSALNDFCDQDDPRFDVPPKRAGCRSSVRTNVGRSGVWPQCRHTTIRAFSNDSN